MPGGATTLTGQAGVVFDCGALPACFVTGAAGAVFTVRDVDVSRTTGTTRTYLVHANHTGTINIFNVRPAGGQTLALVLQNPGNGVSTVNVQNLTGSWASLVENHPNSQTSTARISLFNVASTACRRASTSRPPGA